MYVCLSLSPFSVSLFVSLSFCFSLLHTQLFCTPHTLFHLPTCFIVGLDFMSLALFFKDVLRLSNDYSCTTLPFLKDKKRFQQIRQLLTSAHVQKLSADQQAALLRGVTTFVEIVSKLPREHL